MVVPRTNVQVPMCDRLAGMVMGVPVEAAGDDTPQAHHAEEHEQRAAEEIAAALDDERKRPAEGDQHRGAKGKQ